MLLSKLENPHTMQCSLHGHSNGRTGWVLGWPLFPD